MSYHSSRIIENIMDDEYTDHLTNFQEDQAIIEMVIELDSESSVTLQIRSTDEPVALAKKFCYLHNIDPKIINSLANNIRQVQATSFKSCENYKHLIHQFYDDKENRYFHSNSRINETGLSKTHKTTFNQQTRLEDRSATSQTNVFDRLYENSKQKHSRRTLSKQSNKIPVKILNKSLYDTQCLENIQTKIYEKNTKLKEERNKKNDSLKIKYEEEQNKQCTLHPQINPLSNLIAIRLKQMDSLSKSREKKLAKTINYLKNRESQEMKQCSFHPKILKKSKQQVINTQRFLLLHEDHYIREMKAQTVKAVEVKKMFAMNKPSINAVSKRIVGNKSFENRILEYQVKMEKNKARIVKEMESQFRYHPKTGKNPQARRRDMSVGEYLYSKSLEKKKITNEQIKPTPMNKNSEKLYEESKKNSFRYIFTLMDSDQDGFISALKINILGLETEILHLLAPLLCEMQDLLIELDEEEFVDSLERLFKTFTIQEKNMIMNVCKNPLRKRTTPDSPSFHPSLNEKSIEIARQRRQPGVSLYDQGREQKMEKQAKLNELRALKALMEFQECTFHPNLFHHN